MERRGPPAAAARWLLCAAARRDDKPFELALDDNDASRLLYTKVHNGKNLVKLSVFYLFLNSFRYIFCFYQKRENNCMDILNI